MANNSRFLAAIFLMVVCVGTIFAAIFSTYTVGIVVDGDVIVVKTSAQTTDIILQQAGVSLGESDKLDVSEFKIGDSYNKKNDSGNKIYIKRAHNVTIIDDGEEVATIFVAGTVSDALTEAGITCRSVDKMNFATTDEISEDMTVTIQRAFSVDVKADGVTQTIALIEGTVADILEQLQITLGENDEVTPSLTTVLKAGTTVSVYRVSYEEREKTETIKYETIKKTSSELDKGVTQVEQEGKNGTKTVIYKDKIVDGKVVKTTKVSETVVTAAVNKIVVTGTKIKVSASGTISPLTLPSKYTLVDGIPSGAIESYTGRTTAYTGGGTTASGKAAQVGYVAVDPKVIPYGSELYVVSEDGKYIYGYCIAADCGNFTIDEIVVDVYLDSKAECRKWGNKRAVVYVLSKGNGRVS